MGFEDQFRMSVHAVITNSQGEILQIKQTYGDLRWGLPGGALEPGETVHESLIRECREELGLEVVVKGLTGIYFHKAFNSQVVIFRCELPENGVIKLSEEHSEWKNFPPVELSSVQRIRVEDCLSFQGVACSRKF